MCAMKLNVPAGFTVSTEACLDYYKTDKKLAPEIVSQVKEALEWVENYTGKKFGDVNNPLLFSVLFHPNQTMTHDHFVLAANQKN